jgi:hypothetical protein
MPDAYEHLRRFPLNVVLAALGFDTFKYRKAGTDGYLFGGMELLFVLSMMFGSFNYGRLHHRLAILAGFSIRDAHIDWNLATMKSLSEQIREAGAQMRSERELDNALMSKSDDNLKMHDENIADVGRMDKVFGRPNPTQITRCQRALMLAAYAIFILLLLTSNFAKLI